MRETVATEAFLPEVPPPQLFRSQSVLLGTPSKDHHYSFTTGVFNYGRVGEEVYFYKVTR